MLKIKAKDVLFFRTGRSFNRTFDINAETFFPPYPSTIYGALRTAYFMQKVVLKILKMVNSKIR